MTDRPKKDTQPLPEVSRVRRPSAPSLEPRDKAICFAMSQSEKDLIDQLALSTGITRSALLGKIVLGFVEDVMNGEQMDQLTHLFKRSCEDHKQYGDRSKQHIESRKK